MQNKETTEEAADNYTKDELSKLGFINDDKWLKDRISNLNAVTNHLIFQKCYNEIIKSVLDTEMKFLYEKEKTLDLFQECAMQIEYEEMDITQQVTQQWVKWHSSVVAGPQATPLDGMKHRGRYQA